MTHEHVSHIILGRDSSQMYVSELLTLYSLTICSSPDARHKDAFLKRKIIREITPFVKETGSHFLFFNTPSSAWNLTYSAPQVDISPPTPPTPVLRSWYWPPWLVTSILDICFYPQDTARQLLVGGALPDPPATVPTAEGRWRGGQESVRAVGWKSGVHLPQETWLKLSPHLGPEKDSLNTILMSGHGVSAPLLAMKPLGTVLSVCHYLTLYLETWVL